MCQPKGFSQKLAAGLMVQENTLKPALISIIGLARKPMIHEADYKERKADFVLIAKESSRTFCMPVLFLHHSWWVTFPEDLSSLSVNRLWMQWVQAGTGMVCI